MIPLMLILLAAVLSGLAVAAVAKFVHWPTAPLAVAASGTFVAVLVWRLLANLWALNEDFMPLVSIGDTGCLVAGGLAPALSASAAGPLPRKVLVTVAGAVAAFAVNVVVL